MTSICSDKFAAGPWRRKGAIEKKHCSNVPCVTNEEVGKFEYHVPLTQASTRKTPKEGAGLAAGVKNGNVLKDVSLM